MDTKKSVNTDINVGALSAQVEESRKNDAQLDARIEVRNESVADIQVKTEKLRSDISKTQGKLERINDVATNTQKFVWEINREFEAQTGLKGVDYGFLFLAIALQCTRIYFINKLLSVEKAGQGNSIENYLHEQQEKMFKHFNDDRQESAREYYSPLHQILTLRGVPYDATGFADEKYDLFKGTNHRFATLGHEPLLGLIFGTANILTSTITTYNEERRILGLKLPITNHVVYDDMWKNPRIGQYGLTTKMLALAISRINGDKESVVAALIKQVIHIGTDTFTPCGISLPFINLVLDKRTVEEITKYVSAGDMVKIGSSAVLATGINFLIGVLHNLLYDETSGIQRGVYNVKTRKIIMLSNVVATSSSVIKTAFEASSGKAIAWKNMDWGGLIVTIYRLIKDKEFIDQVKHEFIVNEFVKKIKGE